MPHQRQCPANPGGFGTLQRPTGRGKRGSARHRALVLALAAGAEVPATRASSASTSVLAAAPGRRHSAECPHCGAGRSSRLDARRYYVAFALCSRRGVGLALLDAVDDRLPCLSDAGLVARAVSIAHREREARQIEHEVLAFLVRQVLVGHRVEVPGEAVAEELPEAEAVRAGPVGDLNDRALGRCEHVRGGGVQHRGDRERLVEGEASRFLYPILIGLRVRFRAAPSCSSEYHFYAICGSDLIP